MEYFYEKNCLDVLLTGSYVITYKDKMRSVREIQIYTHVCM